jgi:hypothetical protein
VDAVTHAQASNAASVDMLTACLDPLQDDLEFDLQFTQQPVRVDDAPIQAILMRAVEQDAQEFTSKIPTHVTDVISKFKRDTYSVVSAQELTKKLDVLVTRVVQSHLQRLVGPGIHTEAALTALDFHTPNRTAIFSESDIEQAPARTARDQCEVYSKFIDSTLQPFLAVHEPLNQWAQFDTPTTIDIPANLLTSWNIHSSFETALRHACSAVLSLTPVATPARAWMETQLALSTPLTLRHAMTMYAVSEQVRLLSTL